MLIDEKLLDDIDKITTEKYGGVPYVHIPLLNLRNLILSRRVSMKSPEEIERAMEYCENKRIEYKGALVTKKIPLHLSYRADAMLLRWVLNQAEDTWGEIFKLFEEQERSDEKVD
jgi:hypothetical protein